jgi:phage shock protein PspC (stress-responsive transcriptional regulator)
MNCAACGNTVNADARFCSACGNATASSYVPPVPPPAGPMPPLLRPQFGRVIAGVCAGFAEHYGWDVVLVRLVLVAAVLLGFGTPILAYAVAWIVMPEGPYFVPDAAAQSGPATGGSQTASIS